MRFRGSDIDKSHGWLVIAGAPIAYFLILFFLTGLDVNKITDQDHIVIRIIISAFASAVVLWMAQWTNEILQENDKDRNLKYGSYEKWLENTAIDWKNFWVGMVISYVIIIPVLTFLVMMGLK